VSDQRQRALERAAEAGDREAEAELLRERLRSGELARARVELLASLGDDAARMALDAPPPLLPPGDLRALATGLEDYGKEHLVRAAIAAASPLLEVIEEHAPYEQRPRAALAAVEAWLEHQDEARRVGARLAATEADSAGEQLMDEPQPTLSHVELSFFAWAMSSAADLAAEQRAEALGACAAGLFAELQGLYRSLGDERGVDGRVRRALRAWCRGEEPPLDPLEEGVA